MTLVGRLKKLETAAQEQPRVMAAGIVWTTDHEHYAGELQPEMRIVSDVHIGEDSRTGRTRITCGIRALSD